MFESQSGMGFTWLTRALTVLILSALAAGSARGQSQETAPVDLIDVWNAIRHKPARSDSDENPTTMKAIAPVIGAKPSAGVLVGAAGNVAFFTGDPKSTPISSVVASLTFSSKQQTSLTGRFAVVTAGNQWRIDGDNRAQWTSQDTYGLGTSSEIGDAVNAKYDFFRVHDIVRRAIWPNVFVGAGLLFDDHTNIRPGEDLSDAEWNDTAFVQYSETHNLPLDRQVSAGPTVALVVDTRDSSINPYGGAFFEASYSGLIKGFLDGSSGWQLLHLDGRTYVPLGADNRQRIAVWLFGDATFGGAVPYFDLPSTGMDVYGRSGRGYGEGRFRGERLLYGEVEYRSQLTSNGLLGWVAFLNATTISNLQEGERLFHSAAPGAGAGLRALINKRSRTNLCFDVGFGKDGSHGVYLSVQEAF
jgi:hypothetical protein